MKEPHKLVRVTIRALEVMHLYRICKRARERDDIFVMPYDYDYLLSSHQAPISGWASNKSAAPGGATIKQIMHCRRSDWD